MKRLHSDVVKNSEETQEQLKQELQDRDDKIIKLTNKLKDYKNRILTREKDAIQKGKECEKLKDTIRERDERIDDLEHRLSNMKNLTLTEKSFAESVVSSDDPRVRFERAMQDNMALAASHKEMEDQIGYLNAQLQQEQIKYRDEIEELRREVDKLSENVYKKSASKKQFQQIPERMGNNISCQNPVLTSCYYDSVSSMVQAPVKSNVMQDLAKEFESNYKHQDIPSQIKSLIDTKKHYQKFIDAIVRLVLDHIPENTLSNNPNLNQIANVIKYVLEENRNISYKLSLQNEDSAMMEDILGFLQVGDKTEIIPKLSFIIGGRQQLNKNSSKSLLRKSQLQVDTHGNDYPKAMKQYQTH
jgi:chromosome segregation ATPase